MWFAYRVGCSSKLPSVVLPKPIPSHRISCCCKGKVSQLLFERSLILKNLLPRWTYWFRVQKVLDLLPVVRKNNSFSLVVCLRFYKPNIFFAMFLWNFLFLKLFPLNLQELSLKVFHLSILGMSLYSNMWDKSYMKDVGTTSNMCFVRAASSWL